MAFPTPFVSVGPVGIWGQTAAGYYAPIGITTPTAATGVLTLASNAVAGEKVNIGQQTYVWAASANVQTPNVVKIGADASTSIDNLIAAINATASAQGSLYSFNTIPNTQVTAATGAGDTMGVTAIVPGANGNLIPTTETMTGGSWASATLTGGIDGALVTSGSSGAAASQVQGTAADNAVAVGNPVQTGGVAVTGSSYAPGYAVGDAAVLAVDKDSGGLLVVNRTLTTTDNVTTTPVASSVAAVSAYAASKVVKASAGRLFSVNGYNSKGSAQFIQVHNATSLPADTAVPLIVITAPATGNFSIDFGPLGIPLSTGITLANSSTGPALTVGSADVWFTASYV